MRTAWIYLVLAGCGRFGFDPFGNDDDDTPEVDANTIDADPSDPCNAERVDLGQFSTPILNAEIDVGGGDNEDPVLSADRLELFFLSNRGGNPDIWRSTRLDVGDPWGTPVEVPELNSGMAEDTPALSADERTIWFVSNRAGGMGVEDIWMATRADRSDAWSTPVPVPELNTDNVEIGPAPFEGDLSMIFHSSRNGGPGAPDLWYSHRDSTATAWSVPVVLGSPNTNDKEAHPWVSPCGLEMYFQAERPKTNDVYRVTRPRIGDPFGMEAAVSELNSSAGDNDPQLSRDRRFVMFSSYRLGGGRARIFEASR